MKRAAMTGGFDRREILKLGAYAVAAAGLPSGAQDAGNTWRLLFRYRTAPENLARIIPPALQPGEEPLVDIEIEWFEPKSPDILAPEPYGVVRVSTAVEREGQKGRLLIAAYASNDRARLVARERDGMPAKDAVIEVQSALAPGPFTASLQRRGETLFSLTAGVISDEGSPAPAIAPYFAPVFALEPDWRKGVVRPDAAALWKVEAPKTQFASEALGAEASFPFASPGDPLAELPIEEKVGCWSLGGVESASTEPEKIADLDAAALAAWAPLRYDRPVERERVWMPAGWREETTAFRFTDDEIARYQGREEILLDRLEIVEIDAMISQEAHEAMVPPFCRTAGRPMIKVLGLRVNAGALSPVPYSEAWLFAFTITANRMAWYAVSQIVGRGGDLTFGRDTFGYPSKAGEVDIVSTPVDFSMSVKRMGREVCFADGPFHGFSTGTSLAQLPMVSLRAKPGGQGAELVYQMWTFQGRRNRIDARSFQMGFPNEAAPGLSLKADPWYELGAVQPALLSVMENAVMQRAPAEVVGEAPAFEEYYRERCDGVLPWEARPAEPAKPTLLPRRSAKSSS
jgi:hypothetical protein